MTTSATSALDQEVFFVENGAVQSCALRSFADLIETTTRPDGVGPKRYKKQVADGWAVCYWVTYGGPERVISTHESEGEAVAAVEAIWADEIWASEDVALFATRDAAEAALADAQGE